VFFKCENFQAWRLQVSRRLQRPGAASPEEKRRGVIAFSSGNHAQAVALREKY